MDKKPRLLQRTAAYDKPSSVNTDNSVDNMVANCMGELLAAAPAFHRLHLKVNGPGSFAQHLALGDLYEAIPGLVDTVIEGYQGACEKLLEIPSATITFNTVEEALSFIRMKSESVTATQAKVPYSEVVNNMDLIKDALNTAKYKLIFLK